MRRTTMMLAAVAVAMTTVAAGASAQRGMGGMGGRGMAGPGMGRGNAMGAMIQRQLFRGITLTDTQKTQLEKLRDANRTAMQAQAKSEQTDRQAFRTAMMNGDTVALKAARQKLEGYRNRTIALRGALMRNARGVLTPDQQKTFDANRTRLEQRAVRGVRMMRQQRMWGRRQAMMRYMAPNRMRSMRGRGWGPGAGFQQGGGPAFQRGRGFGNGPAFQRGGGFGGGPAFQRGRGGFGPRRGGQQSAPPDSTQGSTPPIGG